METSYFEHMQLYGHDKEFRPRSLPDPTDALPGSPEKLAILRGRLLTGQHLHHPGDPRTIRDDEWRTYVRGNKETIARATSVPKTIAGSAEQPVYSSAPAA